jgi:DNA-binding MarR family transcriptional regulator
MKKDKQEQLSSAEVAQFVQCMSVIFVNARPKLKPEMRQLMGQFKSMKHRAEAHRGVDPFLLGRMSDMLYRGANPTMGELSKALSLPLSTTTRLVGMGVDFGMVQRLPDVGDGRIVRVSLTDNGRKFHEAMTDMHAESATKVLGCLTPEERGILLTLLRKVSSSIEKG